MQVILKPKNKIGRLRISLEQPVAQQRKNSSTLHSLVHDLLGGYGILISKKSHPASSSKEYPGLVKLNVG